MPVYCSATQGTLPKDSNPHHWAIQDLTGSVYGFASKAIRGERKEGKTSKPRKKGLVSCSLHRRNGKSMLDPLMLDPLMEDL